MKIRSCLVFFAALVVFNSLIYAAPMKKVKRVRKCPVTLEKCPDKGCGRGADFAMNRAKNISATPAPETVKVITIAEIKALAQPDKWKRNRKRDSLVKLGEGTPVSTIGFMKIIRQEEGEACNCGLEGSLLSDLHIVLVDALIDEEKTSITVEVSPRVRMKLEDPNAWTFKQLKKYQGSLIRVTGYLFLDTGHIVGYPLKRASDWEVHPITKIEVCQATEPECRGGSSWLEIGSFK